MKKSCVILLIALTLLCVACGKEKPEPTVTLRTGITAGDYALLVIIAAEDAETVAQEIWEYFTTAQE